MALASLLAASAIAAADTFTTTVDVSGLQSDAEYGDPANWTNVLNLGALHSGFENFVITGIGYDLNLTANDPSWLSEITFSFEETSQVEGVFLNPAFEDENPGTGAYSSGGIVDLVALDLDFALLADNSLRLELFEGWDDASVSIDGVVNQGLLTIQYEAQPVPEPATLAALGVGAAALLRRRKNKKA